MQTVPFEIAWLKVRIRIFYNNIIFRLHYDYSPSSSSSLWSNLLSSINLGLLPSIAYDVYLINFLLLYLCTVSSISCDFRLLHNGVSIHKRNQDLRHVSLHGEQPSLPNDINRRRLIVISRFLQRPKEPRRGNHLIHRR